MRRFVSYLLAALLAIAVAELVAPLSIPGISVSARSVVPTGGALQYVDRRHKGNRLDRAVTVVNKRPLAKRPDKIMDGCDPAFSPLSVYASGSNFAGRCST
ncbi:MAG TPA: hypothetical protein VG986_14370 [Pseudolabrys sp.]|nr:hypothetical protein [Pseudolabrys sp.]